MYIKLFLAALALASASALGCWQHQPDPLAHQPHFYVFIQCIVCNFLSWLVVSDADAGACPNPDPQFID
jgi:hypothetical protein